MSSPDDQLQRNEALLKLIKRLDVNDPQENWIGPYACTRTLGKGATGIVKPEVEVAIKCVDRAFMISNADERKRIEREVRILSVLEHPYLMKLHEVIEAKDMRYIVLEYLPGGELYDYMLKQGGKLPIDQVFRFFFELVIAISFMHRNSIVHRDIKMENLILDATGNIKVADFGMACSVPPGVLLEESVGSPHYACPEIVKGVKYNGFQADIWSMGVVLFVLLTGTLPFVADSRELMFDKIKRADFRIPTEVPDSAADLLRKTMCPAGEDRATLRDIQAHPWWRSRCGRVTPQMRRLWEDEFPPEDHHEGLHQKLLSPHMKLPPR
eukprot:TRINITY_DN242_c0_g1_i2.p1 TRINITY_DN242_c0_g1~~TRINITY_DN242_c0_g1_i2.p1  ORF type:complete len:325 (+),score=56.26 TRINITY_DN242_c0_g1_i2:35-1009(+)